MSLTKVVIASESPYRAAKTSKLLPNVKQNGWVAGEGGNNRGELARSTPR